MERRKFPRTEPLTRVAVNFLQPALSMAPQYVNMGRGGLCLRLEERALEVRSLVRVQLTSGTPRLLSGQRVIECAGRVAWVVQRLDLRDRPPFVFDIGIEFVEPSSRLRGLLAQESLPRESRLRSPVSTKLLTSAMLGGRVYLPQLAREPNQPLHWHLIITVDGTPCFSSRYASERAALAAWTAFKRRQAKPYGVRPRSLHQCS